MTRDYQAEHRSAVDERITALLARIDVLLVQAEQDVVARTNCPVCRSIGVDLCVEHQVKTVTV